MKVSTLPISAGVLELGGAGAFKFLADYVCSESCRFPALLP